MLMLTYGVLGGFRLGLIYLPAVVAVGYYFEKKRALATGKLSNLGVQLDIVLFLGISVCGSGVGTFIFAPFATYLLDQYGWRGANLIFAALCLQCAVSSFFIYWWWYEFCALGVWSSNEASFHVCPCGRRRGGRRRQMCFKTPWWNYSHTSEGLVHQNIFWKFVLDCHKKWLKWSAVSIEWGSLPVTWENTPTYHYWTGNLISIQYYKSMTRKITGSGSKWYKEGTKWLFAGESLRNTAQIAEQHASIGTAVLKFWFLGCFPIQAIHKEKRADEDNLRKWVWEFRAQWKQRKTWPKVPNKGRTNSQKPICPSLRPGE